MLLFPNPAIVVSNVVEPSKLEKLNTDCESAR